MPSCHLMNPQPALGVAAMVCWLPSVKEPPPLTTPALAGLAATLTRTCGVPTVKGGLVRW